MKILIGKWIILSTAVVLALTMIGIFESKVVLVFGLVWGYVFTRA
jgi:hypothetical protein